MRLNDISGEIVDAAIKVHTALGPGQLESTYRPCLEYEIQTRGLTVHTEVPLAIVYGNLRIRNAYKIDMVVESRVVIELKAIAHVLPVHEAQLVSYLRLGDYRLGLLLNFHEVHMKDGIRRKVNNF